jgi:hypothetical protein
MARHRLRGRPGGEKQVTHKGANSYSEHYPSIIGHEQQPVISLLLDLNGRDVIGHLLTL